MIQLIVAAFQGLASLPRLIDTIDRWMMKWEEARKSELRAEIDGVVGRLEKLNIPLEEKFEIARKLQELTRRL